MTSRRIPINQSGSGGRPPPRPQPGHFQSSLDGSNLPSSPSFVARYRRPGFPEDEESSVTAPSDGGLEGRTTSDDGMRGGEDSIATTEDEGGWGSGDDPDDFIDSTGISWGNEMPGGPSGHHGSSAGGNSSQGARSVSAGEQLPRNAVANVNSRKSSRNRQQGGGNTGPSGGPRRQPSNEGAPPAAPGASGGGGAYTNFSKNLHSRLLNPNDTTYSERSPLIARRISSSSTGVSHSFSPPDSVPFPRRTPLVSAALLAHSQAGNNLGVDGASGGPGRSGLRRLSVISAEAWKEAIEENRGMSTFGQTLFNTINVLIGVGLLAEPLAFADAGWVLGTILLAFCALITNYTAKMLARIMSQDPTLLTYSDVLIKAYGPKARPFIHVMFCFELSALSIALVVLFSDSMNSLFPSFSSTFFKVVSFFIILPTTFLPLRFLSITSLIGIFSSFMLLVVLFTDGGIKRYPPGSLWVWEHTSAWPRWGRFPLSFGLLMSGFAGHAVIPSLYRDMKQPEHFNAMINTAYLIAFGISMLMGTAGYLMFGNKVSDEVTRDMRFTHGYPHILNKIAIWMIAINPVVKYALASAPLVATIEHLTGLRKGIQLPEDSEDDPSSPTALNESAIASEDSASSIFAPPPPEPADAFSPRTWALIAIRPLVMFLVVTGAILIPNFGIVLSLLGSSSAFVICAIGPIGAYVILGRRKDSPKPIVTEGEVEPWAGLGPIERFLCFALLIISICLAVTGTVWTCLPTHSKHR